MGLNICEHFAALMSCRIQHFRIYLRSLEHSLAEQCVPDPSSSHLSIQFPLMHPNHSVKELCSHVNVCFILAIGIYVL